MTILAESGVPGARHLVELPRPHPHEGDASLRRLHVDVGEQAVHPKAVVVAGEGDEGGAEVVEAIVHPLAGLDDPLTRSL